MPELSVAVGAVQDIVPVAIPLSVTPDWVPGQSLITGVSTSGRKDNAVIDMLDISELFGFPMLECIRTSLTVNPRETGGMLTLTYLGYFASLNSWGGGPLWPPP